VIQPRRQPISRARYRRPPGMAVVCRRFLWVGAWAAPRVCRQRIGPDEDPDRAAKGTIDVARQVKLGQSGVQVEEPIEPLAVDEGDWRPPAQVVATALHIGYFKRRFAQSRTRMHSFGTTWSQPCENIKNARASPP